MKTDLDQLMEAQSVDGLLITGPAQQNPAMVYLTGRRHLTNADLIKKRGQPPILFHGPMERDEAARAGLQTISYSAYPMADLLKASGGNRSQALVLRYQKMLADAGIQSGRLLLYGRGEVGTALSFYTDLQQAMPGLQILGDADEALLPQARVTKDADEIEAIRRMGQVTVEVVGCVADFLSSHHARDGRLVKADGQPLRIGEVKNRINLWLAERGAENPEDTIFAIGRDAGVPHSSGNPEDELRLGQTIVFDIYPNEAGGGYFYDFTRTWCLGYAPDEALALYEQVQDVYNTMKSSFVVNTPCPPYQRQACELFEARGHATVLSHPETGLYYPERGLGVRLEDTLWVTPSGQIEVLAPYPMNLVLPVKG